jgi:molecular chaperone GrpE
MTETNDAPSTNGEPEVQNDAAQAETPAVEPGGGALAAVTAERDKYLEMAKRARADFENYQNRIRRDLEQERKYAAIPVITDLLPVLDNLDRALESAKGQPDAAKIVEGLEIVRRQFLDSFARHTILPIRPELEPFDPNLHQAVMQQPSAEHPPMTVLYTVEAGYRYYDRILRPAKVIVTSAMG